MDTVHVSGTIAVSVKVLRQMNVKDEPNNWIGLALILVLFVVFALVIRWLGHPNVPT